jgi:hypothetical protein
MIYVEEAELSRYVFVYFRHLWSAAERAADRALLVEQKTRNREETRYAKVLRQHLGSTDPAVLELVKLGPAAFQSHVVRRWRALRVRNNVRDAFFPGMKQPSRTPQRNLPNCAALLVAVVTGSHYHPSL